MYRPEKPDTDTNRNRDGLGECECEWQCQEAYCLEYETILSGTLRSLRLRLFAQPIYLFISISINLHLYLSVRL